MIIKTDEEIEIMKTSCLLVSKVHELIGQVIKPGITGISLDKMVEEFIRDNNASPSFKGYRGFPFTLCISVNSQVVHGMPKNIEFKDSDLVSVDCGVYKDGYHGDCAYTYSMINCGTNAQNLVKATKESLKIATNYVKAGVRTGDLGYQIQSFCESKGYSVVRELVGHGVGKNLHESPDVPNFGKIGKGTILKSNCVIAIEPMINEGKKDIVMEDDDWTIRTKDNKMSAHFENTIRIGLDKSEEMTTHSFVEQAIIKNVNLLNL